MKKFFVFFPVFVFLLPFLAFGQAYKTDDGTVKVFIVKNNTEGPKVLAEGGLVDLLKKNNCAIENIATVQLSPAEQKEYGEWNQDALESKNIAKLISANGKNEFFTIGLLTNCVDLLGMLSGLQHLGPEAEPTKTDFRSLQNEGLAGRKPLRIGLIYIDAHADFNTPETTLSGMLGGMNVAVASGLCLTRLRLKTGLEPALPTKYIVMAGLRDVDPLEQELLDRTFIEYISVQDIRNVSQNITNQMERLSRLTDLIYVHIDMDVLDPSEVSGHPLTAPEGPTSLELAAALEKMFTFEKAVAIGIASLPFGENDKELRSLKAAYNLIEGAIRGVKSR